MATAQLPPLHLPGAFAFEAWLASCPLGHHLLQEYAVARTQEGFRVSCSWLVPAKSLSSAVSLAKMDDVSREEALAAQLQAQHKDDLDRLHASQEQNAKLLKDIADMKAELADKNAAVEASRKDFIDLKKDGLI